MANDTDLDIIVDELNQDYEKVTKLAPVIPVGKVYSTDDIYHEENGTENGTENENENVKQYNYQKGRFEVIQFRNQFKNTLFKL